MNAKPLVVTAALLASGACAPAAVLVPGTAPTDRTMMPVVPEGARQPQASSAGSIAGTIATNPWHAIRGGGVVYLEDGPRDSGLSRSAIVDNHDMAFVPNFAVIPAGSSVMFTNTDPLVHNVFSPDGEKWDLGEIPQNGSVVKKFDHPGTYTILCNLHTNMLAYLAVTPSNFFAKADAQGVFAIKNVPPGTYHVTAWVPRLKPLTQQITVGGSEVTVNFNLER